MHDDAIAEFNEMKLGRLKYKYIIYKIKDPFIVSDQKSEVEDFQNFLDALPENDCCYAIVDMKFKTHDGRDTGKLVTITW